MKSIALKKFSLAEKRKQWLEAVCGKDRNSVRNQVALMTWDAASFRVVNQARLLAPRAPDGGVQLNGLMHRLLDRCFFSSQMVAIRRLTDTYPLGGERGVYSLTGLLEDIRQHACLLTRQAIFDAEGLEYDYEPIRQKSQEYESTKIAKGEKAYNVPADLVWRRHERRHEQIDRLAAVDPHNRHPGDTLQTSILTNLKQKIRGASEDVVKHVLKFIAHAATPESRALATADEAGITLNHLWEAHRHLCQVARFVAIYLLGDSFPAFLATPQFDQFKYIQKPLVKRSQVSQLEELWSQFDTECHEWSQWGLDEYEQEFGGRRT